MTNEGEGYEIDQDNVSRYFMWRIVLFSACFYGVGIVLGLLYAMTIGPGIAHKQTDALRYWLDGTTLRIDQGWLFWKRKAIPLDRITDLALVQGPLMRRMGIWGLRVQTAGTGSMYAEATLYGLADPEGVRNELMAARDEAVKFRNVPEA